MNKFNIGTRKIGPLQPPFVIAEIGINHNGDFSKAKKMIYDAHSAGAECVKFQCHVVEDEMSHHAKKVIPSNANESIYNIMKNCSFSFDEEKQLKTIVEDLNMIYLSTPFSRAAAERLENMGVLAYKIGSGECNNYPLIEHIAEFGKPIILSTGMNNLDSIRPAIKIFKKHNIQYALLHCTSIYPTPYKKVRLGALGDLRKAFPSAVLGLSDHSVGNYMCFASVAMGASILEKHFTSDKTWPGPDIEISIDPPELKDLIYGSTAVYDALGGTKNILAEEQSTIDFAYASVVTIKKIKKGEILTRENIWVKRPGTGQIFAKDFESLLGKTVLRDLDTDCHVKWNDII